MLNYYNAPNRQLKGFEILENTLDSCGLSFVWNDQYYDGSKLMLLHRIDDILKSQFLQNWHSDLMCSQKCVNYRMFKFEHKFEKFYNTLDGKVLQCIINFRFGNNLLPIEKGRWSGKERSERKCKMCFLSEVGDEFHYLFRCNAFDKERTHILTRSQCRNPNIYTLRNIINTNITKKLIKLANFYSL